MAGTYRLIFTGQCLAGFSTAQVQANLGQLLKLSPEQSQALMRQNRVVLKQGVSENQLPAYRSMLSKLGLEVMEEAESPVLPELRLEPLPQASPPPTSTASAQPARETLPVLNPDPVSPAPSAASAPPSLTLSLEPDDLPPPAPETMNCPQCGTEQPKRTLCRSCGVDMPRYLAAQASIVQEKNQRYLEEKEQALRAPTSNPVDDNDYYTPPFWGFSTDGRLGRLRYLLYTNGLYLVLAGIFTMAIIMANHPILMLLLLGPSLLWISWAGLRVNAFRLHDLGHSGWLQFIGLLPIVNIGLALYLLFWPGDSGYNSQGIPAEPNRVSTWVATSGLVFLFAIVLGLSVTSQYSKLTQARAAHEASLNEERDRAIESPSAKFLPAASAQQSITLYGSQDCQYCDLTKIWLAAHQQKYSYCDIDNDLECANSYQQLGGHGVPLVEIGHETHSGYDPEWMRNKLGLTR